MNILSNLLNKNKNRNTLQINNIRNGRVNIMGKPTSRYVFPLYDQSSSGNSIYKKEALKTIHTNTTLSNLFFSKKNIEIIQTNIRYHVWMESDKKHIISIQSHQELHIIMRSIFLQYSKNMNTDLLKQIKKLNNIVIKYTVPNILSNIELYIGYKKRVSQLPIPLSHPLNLAIKGTKLY